MAHLEIAKQGRRKVRRFELDVEPVTIGRAEENRLILHDLAVSRFHCVVERDGEGLLARDLGSTCGTRINQQRLSRAPLHEGDVLEIGPYRISAVGLREVGPRRGDRSAVAVAGRRTTTALLPVRPAEITLLHDVERAPRGAAEWRHRLAERLRATRGARRAVEARLEAALASGDVLRARVEHLEAQRDRLQADLEAATERAGGTASELSALRRAMDAAAAIGTTAEGAAWDEQTVAALRARIAQLEVEAEQRKAEAASAASEVARLGERLEVAQRDRSKQQRGRRRAERRLARHHEQGEAERRRAADLESRLDEVRRLLERAEARVVDAEARRGELQGRTAELEERCDRLRRELEQRDHRLEDARSSSAALIGRLRAAERQEDSADEDAPVVAAPDQGEARQVMTEIFAGGSDRAEERDAGRWVAVALMMLVLLVGLTFLLMM